MSKIPRMVLHTRKLNTGNLVWRQRQTGTSLGQHLHKEDKGNGDCAAVAH